MEQTVIQVRIGVMRAERLGVRAEVTELGAGDA
jgi:hypothetical protein